MGERAPQICVTVDQETASTLSSIKEDVGISEVELTRVLLRAVTKHYKKFGVITLPIALVEPALSDHPTQRKARAS